MRFCAAGNTIRVERTIGVVAICVRPFKFGQPLTHPDTSRAPTTTRLYTVTELEKILTDRGMKVRQTYGAYNESTPASDDHLTLLVYSQKY